jgi:hypothetical protein
MDEAAMAALAGLKFLVFDVNNAKFRSSDVYTYVPISNHPYVQESKNLGAERPFSHDGCTVESTA